MSMRSTIGVKVGNEYRTVYCHLDGYPSGVGVTLLNYYNSQELAEELVKEGDIVSLGKACSCQKEHSHKNEIDGYTVYYGRDLGEKGTKYITSEERPKLEEDFLYIFENGKWFVSSIYFEDQTQELTQELIDSEE